MRLVALYVTTQGDKRSFYVAHLELAVYFEYEFAQRGSPARRGAADHTPAYGTTERGRAKRDVPEGLIRSTRRRLILEEV